MGGGISKTAWGAEKGNVQVFYICVADTQRAPADKEACMQFVPVAEEGEGSDDVAEGSVLAAWTEVAHDGAEDGRVRQEMGSDGA